jgi:hypothetical protein
MRDGFSIEHHDDGLMTIKGRARVSGEVVDKIDDYFDNLPEEKFKEIGDRVDREIKQENFLARLDPVKVKIEPDLELVSVLVDKLIDIINDDDFEKEKVIQDLENLKKSFEKIEK